MSADRGTTTGAARRRRRFRAVLLDSGDTLVDEGTEVEEAGVTVRAELLPGARETLVALEERYPLGLVADGRHQSYLNVLGAAGVLPLFGAIVSSELAGAEKPAAAPFERCLSELGIPPADFPRVVMAGNRLDRDVAGAQALGLATVWLRGSPRYPARPRAGDPTPDATIDAIGELPAAVARLEAEPGRDPRSG